ncbi:putative Beta-carotene hydroxylase [Quillaja saponaria]|uniref:beta-carotene 3-hydroxylase n=1 Tax=Quillaja saponaria TaxID=32244 RepID=A0AAD7L638_QUISA|nr:putative Beta-carotene hydroxylase [Quillaja saponaria]
MAATGITLASSIDMFSFNRKICVIRDRNRLSKTLKTHLQLQRKGFGFSEIERRTIRLVMEKKTEDAGDVEVYNETTIKPIDYNKNQISISRGSQKLPKKTTERYTYLVAAILSSFGITSMAAISVYYRFSLQMEVLCIILLSPLYYKMFRWYFLEVDIITFDAQNGEFPVLEMLGTFALSVAAAVGMEFWAKWAHRALWHASLWHMHESHHRPRDCPFELNDVFAIINALPAIARLSFGFFNKGLLPGLCFGAEFEHCLTPYLSTGSRITMFGMAYLFVHDGLVHRRFPVGPIANVPHLRRVAAAHHLHHSDRFKGVRYGLFLGPMVRDIF